MTKAKTTSSPAAETAEPKTDASTFETKAKRPRGKAVPANEGSAKGPTSVAPTETPVTDAIPAATPKPPRQTKAALLRARLAEAGGVSLSALIEAIGWQAHTLRAALSGLRKEGLTITRRSEGDDTIYAIAPGRAVSTGLETTELAGEIASEGADTFAQPPDGDATANADVASSSRAADSATA